MKIVEYNDFYFDGVSNILNKCFGVVKSNIKDDRAYEFVCLKDELVVGYFILNEVIDVVKDYKIFYINYVCVDPGYQGMGIGKSMMEYVLDFAKKSGCKRVELSSNNNRLVAHKLYLSLGFEKRDSSIFRKELV